MKKREKYYYDIADELFKQKDINKYAKINTISKKGVSISETTIFSSNNPFNKEKGTYCSFVFNDLEDFSNYNILLKYLKKYLKGFVEELVGLNNPKILFVGLIAQPCYFFVDSKVYKIMHYGNHLLLFDSYFRCLRNMLLWIYMSL